MVGIFHSINALIIPNVLGSAKADLFQRKIKEFGGTASVFNLKIKENLGEYSHLFVDASLGWERLEKIIGIKVLQMSTANSLFFPFFIRPAGHSI